MGRARGANAVFNAAFESAYGVPPATGYLTLPFVSSQLGATRGLIESDLLGQGRAPFDPTPDVTNNDGDVVVPVDGLAFGYWLRLLFGAPATTPLGERFQHLFTSGAISLPSMSAEIGMPDVPSFSTNYGIRAGTLQIQSQRSGLLTATIGCMAKGETVASAVSNAPNPTSMLQARRFPQAAGNLAADGVPIGSIVGATLSFSNGMEKIETIRGDGEVEDIDPGVATASGSITVKYANTSLAAKAMSGAPISLTIDWSTVDQQLSILLTRVFLPVSKKPITGPGGIQVEYAWQASADNGTLMRVFLRNMYPSYA